MYRDSFQDTEFEAIVTVNVTTLLVLTTLFIGISNSLPKTAYIKVIDIWLITNLMIPFLEVLLHTIIDILRNQVSEKNKEPEKLFIRSNNGSPRIIEQVKNGVGSSINPKRFLLEAFVVFGRVGLPALYILFCIVVFGFGMMNGA